MSRDDLDTERADQSEITIFGRVEEGMGDEEHEERAFFTPRTPGEFKYGTGEIDASKFKERLASFLARMDEALGSTPDILGGFGVDSVTITLEVSAKGSISLLGTGGEAAGKGGISLTLRRPANSQSPDTRVKGQG